MKHHRPYPQQTQANLNAGIPACNSWRPSSIAMTFWGLVGRLTLEKHGGKHTTTHIPACEIWEITFLITFPSKIHQLMKTSAIPVGFGCIFPKEGKINKWKNGHIAIHTHRENSYFFPLLCHIWLFPQSIDLSQKYFTSWKNGLKFSLFSCGNLYSFGNPLK